VGYCGYLYVLSCSTKLSGVEGSIIGGDDDEAEAEAEESGVPDIPLVFIESNTEGDNEEEKREEDNSGEEESDNIVSAFYTLSVEELEE
jgi:hypothetical protein